MSNPPTFSSATPKLGLPMLIAGQAQKEFFVNQALSIIDSVLAGAIVASLPAPPTDAADGACYRVTAPAAEAWEGCEDHLAIRIGGDWHFVAPRDGMRVFDSGADRSLFFRKGWQYAEIASAPSNGAVIDLEARAAINQLIAALRDTGIFASAIT